MNIVLPVILELFRVPDLCLKNQAQMKITHTFLCTIQPGRNNREGHQVRY